MEPSAKDYVTLDNLHPTTSLLTTRYDTTSRSVIFICITSDNNLIFLFRIRRVTLRHQNIASGHLSFGGEPQ